MRIVAVVACIPAIFAVVAGWQYLLAEQARVQAE